MSRPLILVTNDDSYIAPGIKFLTQCMAEIGDVVVVAPKYPQSGMAHSITIRTPLRLSLINETHAIKEYYCDGTPVDCVKLAIDQVFERKKPDLLVSGINHGSNTSINVIYSGTASAAMEGAILNIPSIAFSILEYSFQIDFSPYKSLILQITNEVLQKGIPAHTCLNVNIPYIPAEKIKGIKVCRQAIGHWIEEYEKRQDPNNRNYYWLTGYYVSDDLADDTDEWAIKNNYISIVPVTTDYTAHKAIPNIQNLNYNA